MNAKLSSSTPLAPLAKRRLAVLGLVLGWLVMVIATVLGSLPGQQGSLPDALHGFGLGLTFIMYVFLMFPHRLGLPTLKDATDERQHQRLLEVYTLAYRILGVLALLGVLYLLTANGGLLPMPHLQMQWNTIMWTVIILVGALPTMILAWTEKDFRDE